MLKKFLKKLHLEEKILKRGSLVSPLVLQTLKNFWFTAKFETHVLLLLDPCHQVAARWYSVNLKNTYKINVSSLVLKKDIIQYFKASASSEKRNLLRILSHLEQFDQIHDVAEFHGVLNFLSRDPDCVEVSNHALH